MNKLLLFSVFSILTLNIMAQEKIIQTAGRTQLGEFASKFAELNDDVLFGEIWNRTDKLGLRDRSLVTITSLISQGITDNSLVFHLQSAKKNGITRTEIAETITHIGFYAGAAVGKIGRAKVEAQIPDEIAVLRLVGAAAVRRQQIDERAAEFLLCKKVDEL